MHSRDYDTYKTLKKKRKNSPKKIKSVRQHELHERHIAYVLLPAFIYLFRLLLSSITDLSTRTSGLHTESTLPECIKTTKRRLQQQHCVRKGNEHLDIDINTQIVFTIPDVLVRANQGGRGEAQTSARPGASILPAHLQSVFWDGWQLRGKH